MKGIEFFGIALLASGLSLILNFDFDYWWSVVIGLILILVGSFIVGANQRDDELK